MSRSSSLHALHLCVSLSSLLISLPCFADNPILAFRVAKVVTMDPSDTVVNNAVVIVENGKIKGVSRASEAKIPDGAQVVEMSECWLVPGFVDCHNHTAGSLSDLNDMVYLTNPGLRTLD